MSSMQMFLAFIVAMVAAGYLTIFLLAYLVGVYDKYRARKRPDAQPKDAPQPSP